MRDRAEQYIIEQTWGALKYLTRMYVWPHRSRACVHSRLLKQLRRLEYEASCASTAEHKLSEPKQTNFLNLARDTVHHTHHTLSFWGSHATSRSSAKRATTSKWANCHFKTSGEGTGFGMTPIGKQLNLVKGCTACWLQWGPSHPFNLNSAAPALPKWCLPPACTIIWMQLYVQNYPEILARFKQASAFYITLPSGSLTNSSPSHAWFNASKATKTTLAFKTGEEVNRNKPIHTVTKRYSLNQVTSATIPNPNNQSKLTYEDSLAQSIEKIMWKVIIKEPALTHTLASRSISPTLASRFA